MTETDEKPIMDEKQAAESAATFAEFAKTAREVPEDIIAQFRDSNGLFKIAKSSLIMQDALGQLHDLFGEGPDPWMAAVTTLGFAYAFGVDLRQPHAEQVAADFADGLASLIKFTVTDAIRAQKEKDNATQG